MQTSYGCIFKKKTSVAAINITLGVPGQRADKKIALTHDCAEISLVQIEVLLFRLGFYFLYFLIQRPLSCSPTAARHFALLGQQGAARRGVFLCA